MKNLDPLSIDLVQVLQAQSFNSQEKSVLEERDMISSLLEKPKILNTVKQLYKQTVDVQALYLTILQLEKLGHALAA